MSAESSKQVIAPLSAETQQIMRRLRATVVGDAVNWDELEALTGKPRDVVRGLAMRAKRKLESEHKMHFRTVNGVGIERIGFKEVATETLPGQRKRIAGAARRMVRTTRNVVLDSLEQSERATVLAHQTLGMLTEQACSNKSAKLLAAELDKEKTLSPLSPREAMAKWLAK